MSKKPLPLRPKRIKRQVDAEGELMLRVIFLDDPQAHYYLDPNKSVVVELENGELALLAASSDAFYMVGEPDREMTDDERLREMERCGRSGRYDPAYQGDLGQEQAS